MDLSQPTVYEPFAHTGYTVQEPEDEHPELATDEQRLIEKQNSRRHRAQAPSTSHFSALVRGVTLCIAITVLAIQSNWISLWYKTRNDIMANPQDHFKPKAWPAVLDIKPAYIMLAVAALSIVFQLLAILTHVSPFRNIRQTKWHGVAFYFSSTILVAGWVGGLVYFKVADSMAEKKSVWDIWSWSCKRKSAKNPDIPWGTMCTTNSYTFFAAIAVSVLEIGSLLYFITMQRRAKAWNNNTTRYSKVSKAAMRH